jgi:signal transduction histidine kinase
VTSAKIMVVEDEGIVARDIQDCLQALGYTVCATASSGSEAIRQAIETQPDLVLMDIVLEGEMDGVEAGAKIRDCCRIPVVYLTAYADEETLQRAKVTEPYAFVLKPFEERELHTVIEIALYKHAMEKRLMAATEERQRLEARIQQAQKQESLGLMAGGIAHDFNNLLSIILGNVSLALLELTPESPARGRVKQIEQAGLRAAELIRQMLAYSGRSFRNMTSVNLSHLIEGMGHLLKSMIADHIALQYRLAADLPAIAGDVNQLQQVVINLISNAAEAIGESGGLITVTTGAVSGETALLERGSSATDEEPGGRFAYLEIADTGCGMDSAMTRKIFDPFFTTKFVGRGLGLAAVDGIVRGHRGTIQVSSEFGRGTAFRIMFPCKQRTPG